MTETERMTAVNNERFENARKRVAHAIMLVSKAKLADADTFDTMKIGQALSLLSHANEELKYACEFFDWDSDICCKLDEAIVCLGEAIAPVVYYNKDDVDYDCEVKSMLTDSLVHLSKALGMFVVWNNEDIRCEDV